MTMAMTMVGPRQSRARVIGLGLGVALLALLLVSAGGERRHELGGRPVPGNRQQAAWTQTLQGMTDELPREHRAAWLDLVRQDPQFLLQINVARVTVADPELIPELGAEAFCP